MEPLDYREILPPVPEGVWQGESPPIAPITFKESG
jgi:hypothetical protein